MRYDERPHPPAARRRFPVHVDRAAPRAHRPARMPARPARRARLHEQFAPRAAGPELGGGGLLDVGEQEPGFARHRVPHRSFVKTIADVGTPSPLVTSETSAPSTWHTDVPRIWRT